jgi:hypothetical protein
MKTVFKSMLVVSICLFFANCAQTEARTPVVVKAAPIGSHFDGMGRVTLHQGQPCAPQVMFNFQPRNARTQIGLAARFQESRVLTEAARRGRRIHVMGVWRHGRDKRCAYVEVAKVTEE